MKQEKKRKSSVKRWAAVCIPMLALLLVVNFLACNVFFDLLNIVMPGGGMRAQYDPEIGAVYPSDYGSKDEALERANELNVRLCQEGAVLLKNDNGALPLKTPESDGSVGARPRISVFGKNSVNIAYGGSGSGGADTAAAVDLYAALEAAGYDCNPVLKAFYEDDGKSGPARKGNSTDLDSGNSVAIATAETPQSRYGGDVTASYADYADAALVVFTRVGGEGFDLPRRMGQTEGAHDSEDTYLQLDQNEADLLAAVCGAGFQRVVVILNSGAAMELTFLTDPGYYAYQDKIDACVWMGFPGNTGTTALAEILSGAVNPSGRTVDTYAADLKKDPSFVNFGDNMVADGDRYSENGSPKMYFFVDYEEGVYTGYKYYETRGFTDGEDWYQSNVVYPFGYGLSYTSFEWEIVDSSSIEKTTVTQEGKYEVQVKVTNTGDTAGKDVVELYAHAPYLDGIEKPHKVLVDFTKTGLLEPGQSETVTLTFDPYYLASYDYTDANGNGFAGYELEGGEGYCLFVSRNAHDDAAEIPFAVPMEGIRYEADPVTGTAVGNLYTDQADPVFNSDTQLSTVLSRADWEGTWPTTPTDDERNVTTDFINWLKDTATNNPNDYSMEDMPWSDEDNGLTLRALLAGDEGDTHANYDDERWEPLLDQANLGELVEMYDYAAFQTKAVASVGKPRTNDTDGPVGFVNFMDTSTYYGTCSYCAEVVIASTWNQELAEEMGRSVGNEGIWGNAKGDGMPYSGWYAPGCNIHRSPFGGRNFEYYSEDGIMNGKMAAAVIRGCQSKGVYCYVKHFALNEQETHRSIGGNCSWVTEQAMRETFLRPFELAVKEGGTRAMMSSFNRIGTRWTGGDYRLLTTILRDEWGFRGMVLCDFNTVPDYMNSRQMAYAGGDLNLSTTPVSWCDTSDVSDVIVLRQCAKNVMYTVANSNAMNGQVIGYALPIWNIVLYCVDGLAVAGFALWGIMAFRKERSLHKKDATG